MHLSFQILKNTALRLSLAAELLCEPVQPKERQDFIQDNVELPFLCFAGEDQCAGCKAARND